MTTGRSGGKSPFNLTWKEASARQIADVGVCLKGRVEVWRNCTTRAGWRPTEKKQRNATLRVKNAGLYEEGNEPGADSAVGVRALGAKSWLSSDREI